MIKWYKRKRSQVNRHYRAKEDKMRGALVAPWFFTTILIAAADNLEINDDHNISTEPYVTSATVSNVNTDEITSAEVDSRSDLTVSNKKNVFFNATECYSCVGCNEVSGSGHLKICPFTSDISKQNKCIVHVEKYANVDRPWYIRGCASERDSCAEILQAYSYHSDLVKLESCVECEGDRCNKTSLSRPLSFASVTFFVIITPLIAKYTLS